MIRTKIRALAAMAALLLLAACAGSVIDRDPSGLDVPPDTTIPPPHG